VQVVERVARLRRFELLTAGSGDPRSNRPRAADGTALSRKVRVCDTAAHEHELGDDSCHRG
jgi:hypothetical protein